MQRTARYFHRILISRAVWNFYLSTVVVAGLIWPALFERIALPVPSPPMWLLVVAGFIAISGVMSVLASRHRVDYRPVLYSDVAGRLWYILVYAMYHAQGHGHWALLTIASIDFLMVCLGLDFLRHYPKLAAEGSAGARRA